MKKSKAKISKMIGFPRTETLMVLSTILTYGIEYSDDERDPIFMGSFYTYAKRHNLPTDEKLNEKITVINSQMKKFRKCIDLIYTKNLVTTLIMELSKNLNMRELTLLISEDTVFKLKRAIDLFLPVIVSLGDIINYFNDNYGNKKQKIETNEDFDFFTNLRIIKMISSTRKYFERLSLVLE